jgi:alpha-glucosidase
LCGPVGLQWLPGLGMRQKLIARRSLLLAGAACLVDMVTGARTGDRSAKAFVTDRNPGKDRPNSRDGQATNELYWWQRAPIYQIYPLSFQDSNGDGMGDLPGIISRLDHLSWLGIGAVWLSPVYPSPMADLGYDISDFTGVDPIFGDLATLDCLIEELHERGIKLMLDFVPNHTASVHPWFLESRASRSSPKRDWYVWVDPAPDGGPPNNWLSRFGGSGWEFDPPTGQYYYHSFLKEQPDLNWHNPAVRRAMADVLRFWLRRGIDGFRVDAAGVLLEDALLRDDPLNPNFRETTPPPDRFKRVYTDSRPETPDCLAELRDVVDEFPDRVLLGEVDTAGDRLADFYGRRRPCLHLPLNYGLRKAVWDQPASLSRIIDDYLGRLPEHAWPCWASGCHDMSRIASRAGSLRARAAAMLLFTLPGTTIIYAGDEIGMVDVAVPSEQALDVLERRVPGYGLNRDPYRAPMRWSSSPNAGFTSGHPWLPIGGDAEQCNVASERRDPHSLLALYRGLIALKNTEPLLQSGYYQPAPAPVGVFAFGRHLGEQAIHVGINLSDAARELTVPGHGTIELSTHLDRERSHIMDTVTLRPYEGVIVSAAR